MANELPTTTIDGFAKRIAERGEQFRRQAIRETDWNETAVLRLIEYQPEIERVQWEPEMGRDMFSVPLPEYEAKRYEGRAPPLSEHADRKRTCSIQTVTKPLLDAVCEEYPDLLSERDA